MPVQSVTTAPANLKEEQAGRLRRYLVMMSIRLVCFVGCVVVEGWLRWVCLVLAVVLPYVAVVIANAARPRGVDRSQTLAAQERKQLQR